MKNSQVFLMAPNTINSLCIFGLFCLVSLQGACGREFNNLVEETKDAKRTIKNKPILSDFGIAADVPASPYRSYPYQPIDIFHYAAYQSKAGAYNGVQAVFDVYNHDLGSPDLNNKFSSSQIWIESGENENLNSLQVGWNVYPSYHGDSKTHFFILWTSKAFQNGCYAGDGNCEELFQLVENRTVIPGDILTSANVSLKVSKDIKTGDWWIYVNNIAIGYYPKGIFTTLGNPGTVVSIGGMVSYNSRQTGPPMGSGSFSVKGKPTAQIKNIKLIDSTGGEQRPSPSDFTPVPDDHKCYKISPIADSKSHDGYFFSYGGPGGCLN